MATPMSPESNEKQQLIVTVDSGEMGVGILPLAATTSNSRSNKIFDRLML